MSFIFSQITEVPDRYSGIGHSQTNRKYTHFWQQWILPVLGKVYSTNKAKKTCWGPTMQSNAMQWLQPSCIRETTVYSIYCQDVIWLMLRYKYGICGWFVCVCVYGQSVGQRLTACHLVGSHMCLCVLLVVEQMWLSRPQLSASGSLGNGEGHKGTDGADSETKSESEKDMREKKGKNYMKET